jgi:hypothetical protein
MPSISTLRFSLFGSGYIRAYNAACRLPAGAGFGGMALLACHKSVCLARPRTLVLHYSADSTAASQ